MEGAVSFLHPDGSGDVGGAGLIVAGESEGVGGGGEGAADGLARALELAGEGEGGGAAGTKKAGGEDNDRDFCFHSRGCGPPGFAEGTARRAAAGAWEGIPSDAPAFAEAPAGKQVRAHAHDLITFSPRQKTDWGKKRSFLRFFLGSGCGRGDFGLSD